MMSSQILWQFNQGDRNAQLLLLPYISINSSNDVRTGGFGSTDQKQSLWTSLVSEYARPNINIKINSKRFSGLLDIGSDITIISKHLWPKSWPIQKISYRTAEISQTKIQEVYQNVQIYPYKGPQQVMPSNHLVLCHPLLLLPSIFPSIRVFSNESTLRIRWPKHWSFSFSISSSPILFRIDFL